MQRLMLHPGQDQPRPVDGVRPSSVRQGALARLTGDRFWWAVGLLLLLGLALRVLYVLHTQNFVARVDARSYDYLAKTLAKGHGWGYGTSAYRPPGYPIFLAGIYLLVGIPHQVNPSWTDARLVEAVFSTIGVGLIGLMAWQVAGRAAALIALFIAALYLPLVLVGDSLMSESLFVLLVLIATNCALRARVARRRWWWIVAAGVFSGFAALTRGNGLVVGIALALVVWTVRPRWSWRALAAPLVLVLVMCLTISPWTIRNANAQHAFIPVTTELGTTLGGTYNDTAAKKRFMWQIGGYPNYHSIKSNKKLTEAQRDSQLTSAVFRYIGKHPLYPVEATFWNTMRLLELQGRRVSRMTAYADTFATAGVDDVGVVNFWIVAVLAIVGAFTLSARRMPRSLWAVPLLLWITTAPIVAGTPRHRAAMDPFVILLAACGVKALVAAVARSRLLGSRAVPALTSS